jgi:hypothetical protein
MSLSAGERLGPYEILNRIGAGGHILKAGADQEFRPDGRVLLRRRLSPWTLV